MRKRTLTVTCRYELDELAEQHLADAYELLLKYIANNEKEVELSHNSSLICKSIVEEPRTEQHNREPNSRA